MELTREEHIKLYTNLLRVRRLDELLVQAYYSRKLAGPFFHSQQGQEAIGVGVCTFLREDDYLWYTHRGHGLCEVISKGLPPRMLVAEHYGRATGSSQGIGFINTCYPEAGIFGMGGTVGGESTLAAGTALAAKLRGNGQVAVCFFGDGAVGEGSLHTALLMSANWKLPIIWICSNNGMGMWVPASASYPKENIADLAFGYDIPAVIEDGQDVAKVCETAQVAVERARAGEGPSFIEFKTCRYRSQAEGLPDYCQAGLRDKAILENWKARDPIQLCEQRLLQAGLISPADVDEIRTKVSEEVEEAEQFALGSPLPQPEVLTRALYAD
jgi:TPP-dependent pyruvate/acetoin dehydrogenase alpha subunit